MSPASLYQSFLDGLLQTSALEYIAVLAGIASVWFSKKEQVLVYPVGLINTTIFVYLSFKGHLLGEASVNIYYTVMSIYGWWLWSQRGQAMACSRSESDKICVECVRKYHHTVAGSRRIPDVKHRHHEYTTSNPDAGIYVLRRPDIIAV
mgnify:CR=1 FL=1